jgi:hypothetical protein
MSEQADANAAVWQSAEAVQAWAAEADLQERHRRVHRQFMASLLPFGEQEAFTFLDLGAGTGAASRTILDAYPHGTAILADFSAEMMRAGEREMRRFEGRYSYVEFDMAAGGEWPAAIPAALDAVVTSMWPAGGGTGRPWSRRAGTTTSATSSRSGSNSDTCARPALTASTSTGSNWRTSSTAGGQGLVETPFVGLGHSPRCGHR